MLRGRIENIAFGGDGILRSEEGIVVFVPFTAPGDLVTIELLKKKKSHAFGKVLQIETPSSLRVAPHCSLFGSCGGCQLQHLPYETQLVLKKRFVEEALARIGKISIPALSIVPSPSPWTYRRHIRLNLRPLKNGFEAGYIGHDGVSFLPCVCCPIFNFPEDPFLGKLQSLLKTLSNEGITQGSLRVFKMPNQSYLLAFSFSPTLPKNRENWIHEALSEGSALCGIMMRAPQLKEAYGDTRTLIEMDGLQLHYSAYGFLQSHPEQSAALYRTISAQTTSSRKILDLYCGMGVSSIVLARKGHNVVGVESHGESILLAKKNASLNRISTARFLQGKAEELAPLLLRQFNPDTVLVNPPRTGLFPSLAQSLGKSSIPTLLYLSCMPSTLARDLKAFAEYGYQIQYIQAFDMFPQTTHVEVLVKMARPQSSSVPRVF